MGMNLNSFDRYSQISTLVTLLALTLMVRPDTDLPIALEMVLEYPLYQRKNC